MRRFAIGLLLALTGSSFAAELPKCPYEAIVDTDGAFVRSGQGKDFYPTGRLKRGDSVTVRRHDPGGWYMIDPPPGSFSWITAKDVKKEGPDRGVVMTDKVAVRVGSFEGDEHSVMQRTLNSGDEVHILGEKMLADPKQPAQLWYKIAPPYAEHRWIDGRALLPVARPGTATRNITDDPFDERYKPTPSAKPTPKTATAKNPVVPPPSDIPAKGAEVYDQPARNNLKERPLVRREGKAGPAEVATETAGSAFDAEAQRRELDRLEAQFRSIIAKDFVEWDFTQLVEDYRHLRSHVSFANYERLIDARLASIDKYQKIKAEQEEFLRVTAETDRRDAELQAAQQRHEAQLVRREVPKVEIALPQPPRFDGAGIVQRTANARPGAPRHVLVAPNGRVLAYLQAQQGIDLDAWVGREVGLIGPRVRRADLASDLLTVNRIAPVKLAP